MIKLGAMGRNYSVKPLSRSAHDLPSRTSMRVMSLSAFRSRAAIAAAARLSPRALELGLRLVPKNIDPLLRAIDPERQQQIANDRKHAIDGERFGKFSRRQV